MGGTFDEISETIDNNVEFLVFLYKQAGNFYLQTST